MKKIVLFGAGGFGRELAYMIEMINEIEPNKYSLLGFVVDEEYFHEGEIVNGYNVLGTSKWIVDHRDDVYCVCAIGNDPHKRMRIQEELEKEGVRFETLIAPDVKIHDSVSIGPGTIITGGTAMTVNINIGKGTVINGRCTLGHDVSIGDYSCIMGGVALTGGVSVGNLVRIGGYVYIIPQRKVGDEAIIAAGSIVFRNVKAGTHVIGNPAKRIEL